MQLSFGIQLSTSAEDNRDLDPDSAGTSTDAQVRLSLGLLSETPVDRLALGFSGALRKTDAPGGTSQSDGFVDPGLSLSYGRSSAGASLELSASLRESELTRNQLDLTPLDGGTPDGTVVGENSSAAGTLDAAALDLVTGTATRRKTNVEASLNWGEDSMLGFGTFARVETTTYRDGTANGLGNTALEDSRRRTLGASARLDLDQSRRLDLGVTWSDFDQDSLAEPRDTVSMNATLTQDRPLGSLSFGLGATRTEDGERFSAFVGRSLALPLGQISGQIGLSSSARGETYLSGGLNMRRDLPRGALSLSLSRAVSSSDTEDAERLSTRASLGLTQELTPLSQIRFGLNLSKAEETGTGLQSVGGDIGATFSHELPSDWVLATGYSHRVLDEDNQDIARSNRVFLELRRTFVTRF